MKHKIYIETSPPPAPKRPPPPRKESLVYPFEDIPVGGAARFGKSVHTIKKKLAEYRKAHPGQQFLVRPISPTLCRVWRTK